ILADEPTGSLDADAAENIFELLTTFHSRGATVLFATHDTGLIRNTKHRIIYPKQGHLQV
ncbi:MAG: cell division ATP-binding protein FtsE, partial [Desulfobacterales bacterium]|nr:cell division ATP-binding protein FtsE [Desulfobacterales bacterium]MDX2512513.1 cell division ATP-binding protein FtsE [Desulfobacterales bacterium]